jgi:hypothetical protein
MLKEVIVLGKVRISVEYSETGIYKIEKRNY